MTVEDSTVILGPPRSGKGFHLVIPAILQAPGAVVTTSTRPDNLTATLRARQRVGPVAVFDPQGLAPGIPSTARWSPIRGCEDPHVAMVRAKALTKGAASGTTDANFWQSSAEQAVRALLHATALGGCNAGDLYRWSLSAVHAREAVMILGTSPAAAPAWHQGLDSIISADPRQRDSVWAMVSIAFAARADPRVLDAVSPADGEQLDPAGVLADNGTVYLFGTSTGAAATAGLAPPELADALRRHLACFPPGVGGRLFVTRAGRAAVPVPPPYASPQSMGIVYRVWDLARRQIFTAEEYASPLAKRPYDLRHAAVSLWLNSGVPATQVAEWAGHSVNVLLRVYASCIVGEDEASRRRVEAALRSADQFLDRSGPTPGETSPRFPRDHP